MAEVKRNLVVFFLLCAWSFCIEGQPQTFVLTPSYFNVAEGKVIQATATCGEGFTSPGERYCKLTGNTADVIRPGEQEIIQGQYCDYCSPENPAKAHPIQHAIDGTEKWWQSPPLSRGIQYNEVNITIDLGQVKTYALIFSLTVEKFSVEKHHVHNNER
ncbi:Laminin subunit alpha-3 [Holothuria leucospilota]|uniref:Laminin subunit alpha-3 n=1 Tax=Holothuria leucospilota TaxID=206669 RepID=A0A9Q0Y8W2_HOLLE|nr:Laminin subunit alpha-3 [Holothuria leucospilota]